MSLNIVLVHDETQVPILVVEALGEDEVVTLVFLDFIVCLTLIRLAAGSGEPGVDCKELLAFEHCFEDLVEASLDVLFDDLLGRRHRLAV